jgi:F-type H+-transporting ATPase subunit gamma
MPSTRDIRRRIKSVKSTAQVTKAMQMVASSKMTKAQQGALAGRPYEQLMNSVLGAVTANALDFTHPLLEQRAGGRTAVILVSTDRGLCAGLNTNLFREVAKLDRQQSTFITAGRKASQFIARTGRTLAAEFSYSDTPSYAEARAISKFSQDLFLKDEVQRVEVYFTRFVNTLTQQPATFTLLPVEGLKNLAPGGPGKEADAPPAPAGAGFLFEPDPENVLGALLPHWVNFVIYQVLLEAKASEHSARMVAMKNATDNADKLIDDLTLEYNKLRQMLITNELLEIASATMALS